MITVGNIFDKIDEVAPFRIQEKWDHSGLLVGDRNNEVRKVLLCLDITKNIALEAAEKKADLVISHHPVIFDPLYTLCNNNPAVILAKNNISAICSHTNMDMARQGINTIIAQMFDADIIKDKLETATSEVYYQLSVFVPVDSIDKVYKAMCSAGAGKLGDYKDCGFYCIGVGRFMPLENAEPFIGTVGVPEKVKEAKLEMIVPREKRSAVISAMLEAHPYEMPAYTLVENYALEEEYGFGKIIKLKKVYTVKEFAELVKEKFGCKIIRYNDAGRPIQKVAFCSGGGGSFVHKVMEMGVDAYICGDIAYDKFVSSQNVGLSLFDAGHYETERIVYPYFETIVKSVSDKIEVSVADNDKGIVNCL